MQTVWRAAKSARPCFPQAGQGGAQALERFGTGIAAEAARGLLVQLEPAQVALRLIVVEGNAWVVEEGEHGLLVQVESFEQIARRKLLYAPALARAACGLAANPPPARQPAVPRRGRGRAHAQVMDIAKRGATGPGGPVADPAVVDAHARDMRPDTDPPRRLRTTPGGDTVGG